VPNPRDPFASGEVGLFPILEFDTGKIRLYGMLRGSDELGQRMFVFQLRNNRPRYGEWRPIFEPNGYDFNIEIGEYDLIDPLDVGAPGSRRRMSSNHEDSVARSLIIALFTSPHATTLASPFGSKRARFLGRVEFHRD
jgi:hypothetical protein